MKDVTQPVRARGTMLSAVALVAALAALLALAPFASAASDPLASGTTTLTLNKNLFKKLKKNGVKLIKVSPATLKVRTLALPVSGGSLDPTNGQGTVEQSGGIKFKHGKRSAVVKAIVVDTTTSAISANVAGKKMKLASVSGVSSARSGFGANVTIGSSKLTGKAAKQLNKKLGFTGKQAKKAPFKGGKGLGSALSETQPKTVTVLPGGNVTFAASPATVKKLEEVEVEIQTLGATTEPSTNTYAFPISGGSISPLATAGKVETTGGLSLFQELPTLSEPLKTRITLGNVFFDLSAHTVSVEVVLESNASKELNVGKLERSSIADLSLTGASVTSNPIAHTVTVLNASATLQPIAAEVLNGFSKVYEGWLTAVLQGPPFFLTEEEAKAAAAEAVKEDHINAGDPLATISFTAQTQ